ncbi:MAG TPA: hypothetical protein VJK51_00665 [Candidatus Nanoarchaeia archaeon]|nr:hypothetical protein [Candidatus Nanoarchaeia archaeon]
MRLLFFLMLFLLIGAFFIISNNNFKLSIKEDLNQFYSLYLNWFASLADNAKTFTGYITQSHWLPQKQNTSADTTIKIQ